MVVSQFQAFAATNGIAAPSSSTAAYCNARSKFEQTSLDNILKHTAHELQQHENAGRWQGHRVVVVDGTGLSTPDTDANINIVMLYFLAFSTWPNQRKTEDRDRL